MATYAHIVNGKVWELIEPPGNLDQHFTPAFAASLVDVSNRYPQPQQGWTATQTGAGWQFAPPPIPVLTLAQQAQAVLMNGIKVVSGTNPTLNGTYPLDPESRSDLQAEVISMLMSRVFTNGQTSLPVTDSSGTPHTFSKIEFQAFVTAIGGAVTTLKAIIAANAGTLPVQPLVIG